MFHIRAGHMEHEREALDKPPLRVAKKDTDDIFYGLLNQMQMHNFPFQKHDKKYFILPIDIQLDIQYRC